MSNPKTFTCINCPLGCTVSVEPGSGGPAVSGNECARGEKYALQEHTDPRRVLTGTVQVKGAFIPRLPVKTSAPIPKGLLMAAARELDRIVVQAPVACGTVLVRDIAGSGADLVAARDL